MLFIAVNYPTVTVNYLIITVNYLAVVVNYFFITVNSLTLNYLVITVHGIIRQAVFLQMSKSFGVVAIRNKLRPKFQVKIKHMSLSGL